MGLKNQTKPKQNKINPTLIFAKIVCSNILVYAQKKHLLTGLHYIIISISESLNIKKLHQMQPWAFHGFTHGATCENKNVQCSRSGL